MAHYVLTAMLLLAGIGPILAYDVTLECIKCTKGGLKYFSYQLQNRAENGYFCLDSHDIRFRLQPKMLLLEEVVETSNCHHMNLGSKKSPVWDLFNTNTTESEKMIREILLRLSSSLKSDVCASTVLVQLYTESGPAMAQVSVVPRVRRPPIRIQFACQVPGCGFTAFRHNIMDEHSELKHRCSHCGSTVIDTSTHISTCPQRGRGRAAAQSRRRRPLFDIDAIAAPFVESERFHLGTLLIYEYSPLEVICIVAELFESVMDAMLRLLTALVHHFGGIRVSFRVVADLIEEGKNFRALNKHIGSSWSILSHTEFIEEIIINSAAYIILSLNYYNEGASNFAVEQLTRLDIHVGEYAPLAPRGDMKLPLCLFRKQGLLNMTGTGSQCFHYCILAHVYGHEMSEMVMAGITKPRSKKTVAKYMRKLKKTKPRSEHPVARYKRKLRIMGKAENYNSYLNSCGIDFSMITVNEEKGCTMHDISIFELFNEISVNVFGHVGSEILPLRLTQKAQNTHVNLLVIENPSFAHFVLIRDLPRCIGNKRNPRHEYCPQCLRPFVQKHALINHMQFCGKEDMSDIILPKDEYFTFTKYEMTRYQDYSMYYSIQEQYIKTEGTEGKSSRQSSQPVPIGYAIVLIGPARNVERFECNTGIDCMTEFVNKAVEIAEDVSERLRNTNNFIPLTQMELTAHRLATFCGACLKPFTATDPKVLDHCHQTGQYVSAKHNSCNLRIRMPKRLSAISMNSKNTSFRSILAAMDSASCVYKVDAVMKSKTEIGGLLVNGILKFVDISNYRPFEKLSELVKEVVSAKGGFQIMKQLVPEIDPLNMYAEGVNLAPDPVFVSHLEMENLLDKKGILQRAQLADCETGEPVSDEQYEVYAKYFYEGSNTVAKYLANVLKHRTLFLAEIMERFRFTAFDTYGLDPLYSWTIASYTFQCAFYFNRLEIGVVVCPQVASLVDDLVRGGYQVITQKQAKSNTRLYGDYDPQKPETFLLYCDIIQSYSNCMKQFLPDGNFQMMTPNELETFDFKNPTFDTGTGYCFQVTLKLDESYHDFFSDMPLSPEHYNALYESNSSSGVRYVCSSRRRYLATLLPKSEKTYYYKTLAFLLQKGFEIIKVHQGFKFSESKFLEPYVDYNTKLRYETGNEQDKRLFKAMLNFFSGKLLVNPRTYPNVRFCFSSVMAKQLLSQDNFQDVILIDQNITLFKMKKTRVVDFNFRGTASVILELGRLELYKLYYDGFKESFGQSVNLILANTDSLFLRLECKESVFLEKLKNMTSLFDFSNLPVDSPLFDQTNKNIPGKLKISHQNIVEFLGLSVCTYSVLTQGDQEEGNSIKCRGIPRQAVVKSIRHSHFRDAVERSIPREVQFDSTRVQNNSTFKIRVSRKALQDTDSSRVFLSLKKSVPWGHYSLNSDALMTKLE